MKTLPIAALLGTTLLAMPVLAQDTPRPSRPDPLLRADANGDGIVTRDEMLASVVARFAEMDSNRDGKIDAVERQAAMAARGFGPRPGRGGAERVETLEDQKTAALRRFDRIDTNGDGRIDAAERDAARARMMERRARFHADGPAGAAPEGD